jgi:hypothetical protein
MQAAAVAWLLRVPDQQQVQPLQLLAYLQELATTPEMRIKLQQLWELVGSGVRSALCCSGVMMLRLASAAGLT